MKKAIFILTALTLALAAPAAAYLGQVVGSFPQPPGNYYGNWALARSPNYLYCINGCLMTAPWGRYIFRLDPYNGSVYGSFPVYTTGTPVPAGLGYSGDGASGYLWYANFSSATSYIYRMNESTGSLLSSFWVGPPNFVVGVDCEDDPYQGGSYNVLVQVGNGAATYRFTPTGSFIDQVGDGGQDPAWDYANKLIWYPTFSNRYVYGYNLAGSLVASFAGPATAHYGAAYLGEYLWLSDANSTSYFYIIHCPANFISVAPASLGKVKALFR